ncbi:hypothetical protein HK101_007387 [Irineochytrium annulatum]|nr:hypothetical protein HK101_007387 [Irineochytrium annulatum]
MYPPRYPPTPGRKDSGFADDPSALKGIIEEALESRFEMLKQHYHELQMTSENGKLLAKLRKMAIKLELSRASKYIRRVVYATGARLKASQRPTNPSRPAQPEAALQKTKSVTWSPYVSIAIIPRNDEGYDADDEDGEAEEKPAKACDDSELTPIDMHDPAEVIAGVMARPEAPRVGMNEEAERVGEVVAEYMIPPTEEESNDVLWAIAHQRLMELGPLPKTAFSMVNSYFCQAIRMDV